MVNIHRPSRARCDAESVKPLHVQTAPYKMSYFCSWLKKVNAGSDRKVSKNAASFVVYSSGSKPFLWTSVMLQVPHHLEGSDEYLESGQPKLIYY